MSFRLTGRAQDDVAAIGDFIAARDPRAAVKLVEAFRSKWRMLADHPISGQSRDDLSPGLRHAVVGNYLTLYRVADDGVTIVRVMDGRRNVIPPDVD